MRRLSIALVVMSLGRLVFASPPEALAISLADARTLPKDVAYRARYLDLTHLPAEERKKTALAVMSFWLNSLDPVLADHGRPEILGDTQVLRIDLEDFGLYGDRADPLAGQNVWERFAYPEAREVYFHRIADKTYPDGKVVKENLHAPWLDPAAIDELAKLTQSYSPIVRGDWFVVTTGQQKDRGRKGKQFGYYDFLHLGDKAEDFQKLIGADAALSRQKKREIRAVVTESEVTLNNRGITRLQSITGSWWVTQDFLTSHDKQNVARLLNGETEPPQGNASEQYGFLPNGLFCFWLQNDKGERQDTAPDAIASDQKGARNDSRVHIGHSCVTCHVEGLRPIDDFARKTFTGEAQIRSPDKATFLRLRQFFLSDLAGEQHLDVEQYRRALARCNGLTPAENAAQFKAFWRRYQAESVDRPRAALELGVTEAKLAEALDGYARDRPGKIALADPLLAAFAGEKKVPMRREYFEDYYGVLQDIVRGVIK